MSNSDSIDSNHKAVDVLPKGSIVLNYGEGEPAHTIIWLHGLGASANDFPPVVPELGLDQHRAVRFIFPQAPNRPITINGGMSMPGWYDIKGMSIDDKQDAVGMAESQRLLNKLVDQQVEQGVPSENIIIAGFSQGGAVAYHTALRSELKFAGVLALSTYLAFANDLAVQRHEANNQTAILVNHGSNDQVVPMDLAEMSVGVLQGLGYQVDYKVYPMEHQVVMEQIKDIGLWINQQFG